jgi:hypothetical protein
VDDELDRTLDAGMDRLHELISRKLGKDPALEQLVEEAEAGEHEPRALTRRRLELALEDAAERDTEFADALRRAVDELRAAPGRADGISARDGGQAVGGNVEIRADRGSAAALHMGDVTLGNPPGPGPDQR